MSPITANKIDRLRHSLSTSQIEPPGYKLIQAAYQAPWENGCFPRGNTSYLLPFTLIFYLISFISYLVFLILFGHHNTSFLGNIALSARIRHSGTGPVPFTRLCGPRIAFSERFLYLSGWLLNVSELFPDVSESFPDVSESFPDVSESFLDVSESFLDVSESFPDVSESFPDVSESFLDVSESFLDVSESCLDVSESFLDVSESFLDVSESFLDVSESFRDVSERPGALSGRLPRKRLGYLRGLPPKK
jgi:hypothetical protein